MRFLLILLVVSAFFASWGESLFAQEVYIDQVNASEQREGNYDTSIQEMDREEAEQHILELFDSDTAIRERLKTFLSRGEGASGSFGTIVQEGDTNVSSIVQRGVGNIGVSVQRGDGNTANLLQQGDQNLTYILQQGNGNEFNAQLIGNENILGVEQIGNNNTYEMDFQQGSNEPLQHRVVQEGNNLSLSQTGISTTGPASVVQRGEGMDLRIEHNQ